MLKKITLRISLMVPEEQAGWLTKETACRIQEALADLCMDRRLPMGGIEIRTGEDVWKK